MNMLPQPDLAAQQTRDTQAVRMPNLWVRMASSGWQTAPRTPDERERARRSALLAWIVLALLIVSVLLIPTGFNAPATLGAAVIIMLGALVAAALNRAGMVTAAGTLLIVLIEAAILGAVVAPGPLSLVYLPAYDIFVVAVVVAAAILPPAFAYFTAALSIVLILADFALQPHSADLAAAVTQYGIAALVTRPIIELVVVSTVAYLLVRGTQEQIRRADRAEEIAHLESVVADQKRALDLGVQELTQAFVRTANGDYNVRVNIPRQNPLWSLGAQMNTFVQRLQQAGQASFELERTRQEAFRLATALDDWRAGRMPLWPAPSGTLLDAIIQRLSGGRG